MLYILLIATLASLAVDTDGHAVHFQTTTHNKRTYEPARMLYTSCILTKLSVLPYH